MSQGLDIGWCVCQALDMQSTGGGEMTQAQVNRIVDRLVELRAIPRLSEAEYREMVALHRKLSQR